LPQDFAEVNDRLLAEQHEQGWEAGQKNKPEEQ